MSFCMLLLRFSRKGNGLVLCPLQLHEGIHCASIVYSWQARAGLGASGTGAQTEIASKTVESKLEISLWATFSSQPGLGPLPPLKCNSPDPLLASCGQAALAQLPEQAPGPPPTPPLSWVSNWGGMNGSPEARAWILPVTEDIFCPLEGLSLPPFPRSLLKHSRDTTACVSHNVNCWVPPFLKRSD